MTNLTNNRIPVHVKKIHLIAVCGTAMGALACMLKDMGYEVSGSDQQIYPPMSRFLSDRHIYVARGFDSANIRDDIDLVVIGNAVSRDNPEVVAVLEKKHYFCSMPQAINFFAVGDKKPLLAVGTHGKTTTASLLAWVLYEAGLDPSFVIGGILPNFESNYRLGQGDYIVIEGDEYDTAFFDKGPKFLHYDPEIAILTGIEFDHADIFTDLAHVRRTFQSFLERMSAESLLLAFAGNTNTVELIKGLDCRLETYNLNAEADWRVNPLTAQLKRTSFEIYHDSRCLGTYHSSMAGEHNLLNTLAVIAAARHIGISDNTIAKALTTFKGIKRRQEIRGQKRNITVIDDFAHHPTAVEETIRAVKPLYPEGRLIAVFEPRTNSSMRKIFQDIYPQVFGQADLVCIREPSRLYKIPADNRFSAKQLVCDLNKKRIKSFYFADTDAIIAFLKKKAAPGDAILIMSNGGFDNIHEKLLKLL
jgi:UDP-N-acetylmuramate: L-alanyl-gamma-D-glutamyl-meso-diaminopimelate ligase